MIPPFVFGKPRKYLNTLLQTDLKMEGKARKKEQYEPKYMVWDRIIYAYIYSYIHL